MRKIIVVKRAVVAAARKAGSIPALACYKVEQDFLRNAHLISQKDEPAFVEEFTVPKGARRVRIITRRTNLEIEFLP